jgi:DNA-binding transcriptional ArsR family regulator
MGSALVDRYGDRVREAAASLAAEAGIAIEHVAKGHIRKEAIVAKVLEQRGQHPGLVHVISAMEACDAYKPWHDKQTRRIFDPTDNALLHALQNPRVNIAGIRRADLLAPLEQLSPARLSRQLRRLREIGVIKRVIGTYRYYLTKLGRTAIAALCHLTQSVPIPGLI